MMNTETLSIAPVTLEPTWQHLWSHAAYQVIASLPHSDAYELVAIGNGWGLRCTTTQRNALVVHRSADYDLGELALTVQGSGTQVIPRYDRGYIEYLDAVVDIVETTARAILQS